MAIEVVHVKRRGMSNKRVINLTKAAPPVKSEPEAKPEPKPRRLVIETAPDGPPIVPDLPEKLRKIKGGPVHKPLTDRQIEILAGIVQKAGEGHPKTLGLRLVLAACEDELAAAWPIELLSKALHLSGRPTAAHAVHKVAVGCRVSRYRDMAANALALLNQKIEAEASA
jgi:hypothetical protein